VASGSSADRARSRAGLLLLAAGVAVAAVSMVLLLVAPQSKPHDVKPTSSPLPDLQVLPRTPMPVSTRQPERSTGLSPSGPPDLLAGPVSDDYLNQALRSTSPSNLEPAVERPLITLAIAALVADLTGAGRERFLGYLPGPAPAQLYRGVRVQAAVARRTGDTTVETHLIWAGTSPRGEHLERHTATVLLRYVAGTWAPQPF